MQNKIACVVCLSIAALAAGAVVGFLIWLFVF